MIHRPTCSGASLPGGLLLRDGKEDADTAFLRMSNI